MINLLNLLRSISKWFEWNYVPRSFCVSYASCVWCNVSCGWRNESEKSRLVFCHFCFWIRHTNPNAHICCCALQSTFTNLVSYVRSKQWKETL